MHTNAPHKPHGHWLHDIIDACKDEANVHLPPPLGYRNQGRHHCSTTKENHDQAQHFF